MIASERPIRLSRFAHRFEREDIIATAHSLTHRVVYLDPRYHRILAELDQGTTLSELRQASPQEVVDEFIDQMVKAKLVVPTEYDEQAYLTEVRKKLFVGPQFNILFFVLTEACNLDCTYCFIEGGKPEGYHNSMMTPETAIAAVDAFARWASEGGAKNAVFYGGEPLLNTRAMFAALDRIDEKINEGALPEDFEKILITNGTLLTAELIEELVRRDVFPYISIDGPPEVHNRHRPYKDGAGSYDDAVRGLELIRSVGIEPGISITADEDVVDNLAENLAWLIENLNVKSVGFNMLEAIPGREYYSETYGERFAEALLRCQDICRRHNVYEERVMRKAKQVAKQEMYIYDCAACGEQLTIAPDGQVGICQGFVGTREFFSGNVHDPDYDPRIDPVFVSWSNVSPLNRDVCTPCPALGLCGGGCPRNPYICGEGINGLDTRFCQHVLRTQEWIIFELYDRMNS